MKLHYKPLQVMKNIVTICNTNRKETSLNKTNIKMWNNNINIDHTWFLFSWIQLDIVQDNNGNFLSADEMPIPAMYFILSLVYAMLTFSWGSVLRKAEWVIQVETCSFRKSRGRNYSLIDRAENVCQL